MGRPKKTVVRVAQESDWQTFAAAESLFSNKANQSTRTRIIREFLTFVDINGMTLGNGLRPWVGAQRGSRVEWSTLDTYCGYIHKHLSGRIPLGDIHEWDHVCSVVSAAHADCKTKSAPTATAQQLLALKSLLPEDVFWAFSVIRFTGARVADIRRWHKHQTLFRARSIRVEVRVTKGRRARKKRRILRLKCIDFFGMKLPLYVRKPLRHLDEDAKVLDPTITTGVINRQLKKACTQMGWSTRLTSYSFRHMYIKDVLEYVEYDYTKALRYTLHCGEDILAAHYDKLEYRVV
jgi:hypothetical protein